MPVFYVSRGDRLDAPVSSVAKDLALVFLDLGDLILFSGNSISVLAVWEAIYQTSGLFSRDDDCF